MPALFQIIDGYNLLHAAGMAQQDYAQGELLRCRNRLLKFLIERLSRAEIARASVVFDARDPPVGFPSTFTVSGLRVLFANPGGDADVLIERLIEEHSAPRQLRLVTSDRRLQNAAKKRRALFKDSEAFFDELNRRPVLPKRTKLSGTASPDAKDEHRLSETETAHWLKVFGEIPEVEELAQRGPIPTAAPVPLAAPPPASPKPARDDAAYWLEVFGEIPEATELKSKPGIKQSDVDDWIAEFEKDEGQR